MREDELLAGLFSAIHPEHARFMALWLAEVFGGPPGYTDRHGGYPHMLSKHLGMAITEEQRRRWVNLMQDAADEKGLPGDPEFRAAFVGYLERGRGWRCRTAGPARTWCGTRRCHAGGGAWRRRIRARRAGRG